jgi:hypothetical protein
MTLAFAKDVAERAGRTFGTTLVTTAPLAALVTGWLRYLPFMFAVGSALQSVVLSLIAYRQKRNPGTASFVKLGGEE